MGRRNFAAAPQTADATTCPRGSRGAHTGDRLRPPLVRVRVREGRSPDEYESDLPAVSEAKSWADSCKPKWLFIGLGYRTEQVVES